MKKIDIFVIAITCILIVVTIAASITHCRLRDTERELINTVLDQNLVLLEQNELLEEQNRLLMENAGGAE